jgi:hypothetical protein
MAHHQLSSALPAADLPCTQQSMSLLNARRALQFAQVDATEASSSGALYVASLYWAVVTVATVGEWYP